MLRQAQCLIRLAQYKEGLLALQKCQAVLDFSKLTEDKKAAVVKDIAFLETEAANLENKPVKNMKNGSTILAENSILPGASPKLCLEVSNDRVRGRFVTAKEDIKVIQIYSTYILTNISGGRGFIPRVSL